MPTIVMTSSSSQLRGKVTTSVALAPGEVADLNGLVRQQRFKLRAETRACIVLPRYQVIDTSCPRTGEYCYVLGISRRAWLMPERELEKRLEMLFNFLEWSCDESTPLYRLDHDPNAAKRSLIHVISSKRPARRLILEHVKLTWEREVREDTNAYEKQRGRDPEVDQWRIRRIRNRCENLPLIDRAG